MKSRDVLKQFLRLGLGLCIFTGSLYLAYLAQSSDLLSSLAGSGGYAGIFGAAFVNGFNVFVPILITSFIPIWLEAGLAFWPAVIMITLGTACADLIAFTFGSLGKNIQAVEHAAWIQKLRVYRERHPMLPLLFFLFWATFIPLPNEVVLIPLGILGYRYIAVIPIIVLGSFIFHAVTAFGVENIFQLIF